MDESENSNSQSIGAADCSEFACGKIIVDGELCTYCEIACGLWRCRMRRCVNTAFDFATLLISCSKMRLARVSLLYM